MVIYHITDDAMVAARFLESIAECFAIQHQVTKDGPTARLSKLTHVHAKIRVVDVLGGLVLDAQVRLDRDVGVGRAHRFWFDVQRAQEGDNNYLELVKVEEQLRQYSGRDAEGFGRSHLVIIPDYCIMVILYAGIVIGDFPQRGYD